jgi:hypothetical protein
LVENNGIRIMFDHASQSAHLLPEHAAESGNFVQPGGQELAFEVDFTRLMAHNTSIASEPWNNVLSAIESAQSKLNNTTVPAPSSKAEVDAAVEDLNALLAQIELDESRARPRRRRSVWAFHRQGRMGMRLARRVENAEETVEMDSVKRKRKKKISKHK